MLIFINAFVDVVVFFIAVAYLAVGSTLSKQAIEEDQPSSTWDAVLGGFTYFFLWPFFWK